MEWLSVCRVGFLLGLAGTSTSAEAGVLGQTSRGTISISVTIAPHVVVTEASLPTQVTLGGTAEALCIASTGLTSYRATLLASIGGRSEVINLPLLPRLPGDQRSCGQEMGAAATADLDKAIMQAIRGSAEPATVLVIPD